MDQCIVLHIQIFELMAPASIAVMGGGVGEMKDFHPPNPCAHPDFRAWLHHCSIVTPMNYFLCHTDDRTVGGFRLKSVSLLRAQDVRTTLVF